MEEGFPGSALLAFKYFLVPDKLNRVAQSSVSIPELSPHQFNDEEEYKPPTAMWGVIRVKGNGNIKEACEALAWDMTGLGLQVQWKEHQSAESSAQVLLMNVPPVLECGGVESKILWHLHEIEKKLLKMGDFTHGVCGRTTSQNQSLMEKEQTREWMKQGRVGSVPELTW